MTSHKSTDCSHDAWLDRRPQELDAYKSAYGPGAERLRAMSSCAFCGRQALFLTGEAEPAFVQDDQVLSMNWEAATKPTAELKPDPSAADPRDLELGDRWMNTENGERFLEQKFLRKLGDGFEELPSAQWWRLVSRRNSSAA